jgi:glycosyltransferase involved in cell wall biosynthesis
MHIVQALVSLNVGGSELVATELSEFMVRQGHRVTVIAADGPIGERVRASGAAHLDWPIGRKRLSTLRFVGRLRSWFQESGPDIVHVHSRWPAWVCWRALRSMGPVQRPRFLTTMHGHYSVSPYSAVMAKGDRVIAVSEHIRRYTLGNYPDVAQNKVITIHGGASREDFPYGYQATPEWRRATEAEFPQLAGKRWLALPGRVTRWKGHSEFLKLLAKLHRDFPDIQGVFVGGCRPGSRYQKELTEQAQQAGILDRITFTGNRLDIRDWMSAAEIVFNLSSDPPEAFGRTVLEALCLGRPLVGWDHGGAAEILATMFPPGAVPPGNMDALEQRVRLFLAEPPKVPCSDAFGLEESMRKHLRVYEDLQAERQAPESVRPA